MARTLLSLPVELQVTIFQSLSDLDDSRFLSQTCRALKSLHAAHRNLIHRAIITSSDVYEYDVCLSKLLRAYEDATKILRQSVESPPDYVRLPGSLCLDCFDTDFTNIPLTDDEVKEICIRWRKLGVLRDLYLDEAITRDFAEYRAQFVSTAPHLRENSPIIQENPELTIQNIVAHEYTNSFKARFYRSLCLHSIALITRSHSIFSRDQTWGRPPLNHIGDRLYEMAQDTWDKDRIVLNGRGIRLSARTQFDCLEIFDFVYYFLLEKVVPAKKLESWFVDVEGIDWCPYGEDEEDALQRWFCLLDSFRMSLQPTDIVDLVKNKTWRADSGFPSSKFDYMRDRGLLDLGASGDGDHFSPFQRFTMIRNLRYELGQGGSVVTPNEHCLWDTVRINVGSPFQSRFLQKLDSEARTLNLRLNREE